MRVVIAGASGLIGSALTQSLHERGHTVVALVRREARGAYESQWDPGTGQVDRGTLAQADAVVNLAGASIGDKRLTSAYARVVRESRVNATRTVVSALVEENWGGVLIQGSAMGFYGSRGEEQLSERSGPGDTLLSSIVQDWEAAAAPAVEAGIRTVFARTGLVLAPHGGFAKRLLPLTSRGLLGALGPGTAWHSWISLEDQVSAVEFLIESDHSGPANIISPEACRDADLIRAFTAAAGKGTGFRVPSAVLEAIIGPAVEDLLGSQHASPGVLLRKGFQWNHRTVVEAAQWVMAAVE